MLSVETYPTVTEAAQAMSDRARYLGGGTLIMRAVTYADQSFDKVIRARQIDRDIRPDAAGLRIGAGATMADLLASRDAVMLHEVARKVGGPALRNMATVGGNLFAPNPYGDLACALLALDAQVVLTGGQSVPVETFLADRARQRALVVAVTVPRGAERDFRYAKVSRIKPKGVSMISIAVRLTRGDIRIAFGNMGPMPLRAKAAERALAHASMTADGIVPALAVCLDGLSPADDALASEWYRREVAPIHLRRLLLQETR